MATIRKGTNHERTDRRFEPAIDTTVKLLGSALYTPEDWEFVKELVSTGVLEIPWFAVPALRPDDGREPQPVLMP